MIFKQKSQVAPKLIYETTLVDCTEEHLLAGTIDLEGRLITFFQELYGENTRLEGFEDITVGWETQIIAFRLVREEPLDLVVRIYHGQGGEHKAEWEFHVMHRLYRAGYPVPRVYSYDTGFDALGSPFIIMERIIGGVLWDVFFESKREEYGDVLALNTRLMSQLHELQPSKVFPGFKRVKTRPRVQDRIREEAQQLEDHALKSTFEPLLGWLTENVEALTEYPTCIIHQDFHPRNILLREDGSPVVIDWGACTLGDYREDLCWTALLAGTFIDESLKQEVYHSYRCASEHTLHDLSYFEAYSGLRRLADAAVTFKAGAAARGMRTEALAEMQNNRLHYARVLNEVTVATGVKLPELSRLFGMCRKSK